MKSIAILSPGFPDQPGGVTDHTTRLKTSWAAAGHRVRAIGRLDTSAEQITQELKRDGTAALLIQYVPFLYGRRGVSSFPKRLARCATASGIRVTTFVHEPWVPLTRLHWLVLSPIQRLQLRGLARACNAVVTAVPAWKRMLDADELVYVGSTLGEPPSPDDDDAPVDAPLVFSPFAAGLNWEWIAAAVAAIGLDLVVIGASAAEARGHSVVKKYARRSWDYMGRLSADDALSELTRARLVLAPFVDGLTARRTSAMAALSAGACLLSNTGPLFDSMFHDSPVNVAATKTQFVESAKRIWTTEDTPAQRDKRLDWYRRHLDPKVLDERLLALVLGDA